MFYWIYKLTPINETNIHYVLQFSLNDENKKIKLSPTYRNLIIFHNYKKSKVEKRKILSHSLIFQISMKYPFFHLRHKLIRKIFWSLTWIFMALPNLLGFNLRLKSPIRHWKEKCVHDFLAFYSDFILKLYSYRGKFWTKACR